MGGGTIAGKEVVVDATEVVAGVLVGEVENGTVPVVVVAGVIVVLVDDDVGVIVVDVVDVVVEEEVVVVWWHGFHFP